MMNSLIGLGASFAIPGIMKRLKDQKVQVLHAMPGRVRLQSDHWKEEKIAEALELQMGQVSLVSRVKASGITGSLLLEFTTDHLTSEQFDALVQLAVDTSISTYPHIESKVKSSLRKSVDSFDDLIKKQTGGKTDAESLLILTLLFKGATGFGTNPAFASSLLYWAYTLIKKDGEGR
ncbi:HMA2 domain-containing protein [Halobacillus sp. A5]|uniref:HMA2 domain-containing protein n=1 Tax=Halobacillus sp. A5 TaxID=2880263 RepID=UPI0020A6AFCA|nr:hypothetical protein [Halobacillus sp. A5]MCP3028732.1 hypothetical protein [Halobacillus sp. A5]